MGNVALNRAALVKRYGLMDLHFALRLWLGPDPCEGFIFGPLPSRIELLSFALLFAGFMIPAFLMVERQARRHWMAWSLASAIIIPVSWLMLITL